MSVAVTEDKSVRKRLTKPYTHCKKILKEMIKDDISN